MKPYLNLFGTSRIPELDSISTNANLSTKHIIVISKAQFYTIEVLNDDNEVLFKSDEFVKVLNGILADSDSDESLLTNAIGAITSDTYRNWKHAREFLNRDHKEIIDKIDSALFVLVLDHSTPDDTDEADIAKTISTGTLKINERGIQTGSCTSRWYDKLQLIVTKNAIAGVVWDSFTQDGTTVLRFTSDIYTDSVLRLADGNYSLFPEVKFSPKPHDSSPKFEKIDWNFPSDTRTFLHLSETRLTDLICSHSTRTRILKFGRGFAKTIGVKSDTLIQVSLQIAHYALYGKPISTVEPVSTRFFQDSRSELLPIQNDLITRACQIFVSDETPLARWQAFTDSCKLHTNSLRQASKGEGFEKHLKALQNVYLQREVFNHLSPELRIPDDLPPLIFDDILTSLFTPDLVASNCGNPAMRVFGLTPAAANGFGIGYIIKDDTTEFCIISQYRQGDRLLSTLEWVLHQINHIWKHHIGKKRIPHAHELDNLKGLKNTYKTDASMVESQAMSRTTTVGSCEEEADIALGGYGYFDIEDLTLRSVQHSTVQTPVLSTSNSYADLLDVATVKLDKNFGKKIINNEKLKESFENHESSESENDLEDSKVVLNRFDAKFDRGQVGKKVDVGEIL
jgi:carnitine O-acetyltransferase